MRRLYPSCLIWLACAESGAPARAAAAPNR